jgi:hypothetical protein
MEELGTRSGTEGLQAFAKPALTLVGSHDPQATWTYRRHAAMRGLLAPANGKEPQPYCGEGGGGGGGKEPGGCTAWAPGGGPY